jgi:hypothetical protein
MTLSHAGTLVTTGMAGVSNVCALLAPKLTGDCELGHTKFAIGRCAQTGIGSPRQPFRVTIGSLICRSAPAVPFARKMESQNPLRNDAHTPLVRCLQHDHQASLPHRPKIRRSLSHPIGSAIQFSLFHLLLQRTDASTRYHYRRLPFPSFHKFDHSKDGAKLKHASTDSVE